MMVPIARLPAIYCQVKMFRRMFLVLLSVRETGQGFCRSELRSG